MAEKWVIVYGDVFEGVQGVVGPFDTEEIADDYGDAHNLGHFDRRVFDLDEPNEEWLNWYHSTHSVGSIDI